MNNNRVSLHFRNLTVEPEVNYSPKGSEVVSSSIANNESYGCAGSGVGRISYASCEFTGKHYGYHDRDHYDHDRYYYEGQSDGNNYRSDRPSIDVHF
jgi:hypothetical protein